MLRHFKADILPDRIEQWMVNGKKGKKPKWGTKLFWEWSKLRSGPGKGKPYGSFARLLKVALGLRNSCWEFIGSKFSGDKEVLISEYDWYVYDLIVPAMIGSRASCPVLLSGFPWMWEPVGSEVLHRVTSSVVGEIHLGSGVQF